MAVDASGGRCCREHRGDRDQGREAQIGHQLAIEHHELQFQPRPAVVPHLMETTARMVTKFRPFGVRNDGRLAVGGTGR
jgi:hypothetical protein